MKILKSFKHPYDFRRHIDWDGNQLPPEYKYNKYKTCSWCSTAWLGAYYLLKLQNDEGWV